MIAAIRTVTVIALVAMGLGAGTASAAVYCVNFPSPPADCSFSAYDQTQLQGALDDAEATATEADTVRIAPGTYAGTFSYTDPPPNSIAIEGEDAAQTLIAMQALAGTQTGLQLFGTANSISNLTISIPSQPDTTFDIGLWLEDSAATGVAVRGPSASNAQGVFVDGASFASGVVDLQLSAPQPNLAIRADGENIIATSVIQAGLGISHGSFGNQPTRVDRSTIRADFAGVRTDSGNVAVTDTLIDLGSSSGTGLDATNFNPGSLAKSIDARHVTIAGGGAGSIGVRAWATAPTAVQSSTLTLADSVISGPATAISRMASNNGGLGGSSVANVTTAYSNYDATTNLSANGTGGAGTIAETNQTNLAPGFADPANGDFSLALGSALVDAGDPAAGGPVLDLVGNPRVTDGDGDGIARRDIGAYERAGVAPPPAGGADTTAPETTITKHPKNRTKRRRARFAFSSSEPGSSFECKLDKKSFEPCASPDKLRVKRGKHTFRVRATDLAGNTDSSAAKDRWKVKRRRR